ncbi:uncharacterized protein LOC129619238 [Condylostylus longicornis]|uniref:uncharacterized protein LOC129619238 n=1 Tax=Condylostylus longicornis TaxID=2530218 RepID=UPI00244E1526|nr:uncharacterized protein LOC129619238 [Condylostylus longicornis]
MNFKKYFMLIFQITLLNQITIAIDVYKVCSGDGTKEICTQMSRGNSEVNCIWVQDSIECAQRIRNKTADFGMFSAESILQLAVLNWPELSIVQPFAHKERQSEFSDFESVVIVRKNHKDGFSGLKGKKYCHPGFNYNPNEKWSERFLKQFERTVVIPKCKKDISAIELEIAALSEFFGNTCRPGIWSHDENQDKELKNKYSSLCELCPNKKDCRYADELEFEKNHEYALKCLKDGGDIAYVSLEAAQIFFNSTKDKNIDEFQYLCVDGNTVSAIKNAYPCTWLRQPWKSIIARSEIDAEIYKKLSQWIQKGLDGVSWESDLRKVLKIEKFVPVTNFNIQSPKHYIESYRPVPTEETFCNIVISWCTTSLIEQEKCIISRAGGISTGIYPQIKCRTPVHTPIQCLEDISRNNADFMGIDSNYGWLARSRFNLTSVLFFDTEVDQFSTIVVVIKEKSNIKSFEDLRGKKICLPEYGSSTGVALINELKDMKIFDKEACNYGFMLKNFFGDSCLPGAQNWKYIETQNTSFTSLCKLCHQSGDKGYGGGDLAVSINTQTSNIGTRTSFEPAWKKAKFTNCEADIGNRYFGNRGGLKCLRELGDVAVLELQSLKVHAEEVEIDEHEFRILCKNNSLAIEPGFDVDLNCALTRVVDGEIVMYRKSTKISSVVHVLQALEHYFIRKNDPSFKIYNIYKSERNLLFKDSTIGLTHPDSLNQGRMVENYKKLFRDIEKCAGNPDMRVYKVCSGDGSKEICTQMSRGDSKVNCVWVQDSIECARRIQNKTADFGMFSAESILQLAVLEMPELSVVQSFAHKERRNAVSDFESVVIVRQTHQNGLDGLKGKKYCHPGFDYNPNEKWSERFFKHFERSVVTPKCEKNKSPSELEVAALSQFFGDSCRPGIWSYDQNEDKELKKQYPSLCKLCPNKKECKYSDKPELDQNHQNALKCLKDAGDVAYVSLQEAQLFFNTTADVNPDDYRYLCADGNTALITQSGHPCTWLRQPWKAVIARSDIDWDIQKKLAQWMQKGLEGISWESALRKVLKVEEFVKTDWTKIQSPKDYIIPYRPVPIDDTFCNMHISWCTVSDVEYRKCLIARAGGISTGIYPQIKCRSPVNGPVQCLEDISRNDTDFMGIDSNYGWLARSNYNLTAALFFDTENDQFSSIVIVIKENGDIKNFADLKSKKVCLPEYGSSTAVSLINELKDKKIFDKNNCNYGKMLKDHFGESCLPGAQDWKYVKTNDESLTTLCSLCFKGGNSGNEGNNGLGVSINTNESGNETSLEPSWKTATISSCAANGSNRYFGNRGALKCLNEVGDFAVLELQSLKVHAEEVEIDANRFKALCRNNSLSKENGFDIDLDCALTTIVDGEIVMYRKSPKTSSVVHVLQALEHYFIRKNNPSFKIYNIYEGQRNILFKDSTIGLTHPDSPNQARTVENYKKLFKDVEKCSGNSAVTIYINALSSTFIVLFAYFLSQ